MGGSSSSQRRRADRPQVPSPTNNQRITTPTHYPFTQNRSSPHLPPTPSNAQGSPPYYLVFGSPPVHYRYNPTGPMIFYLDRNNQPSAPPPEVQESVKVKNEANLLKNTLKLVEIQPSKYNITFNADTSVETQVTIYFANREIINEKGSTFEPEGKYGFHFPTVSIPAETDYKFVSSDILDIERLGPYIKHNNELPNVFPVVVALSYKVNRESNNTDEEVLTQAQYTYAEVVQSTEDNNNTHKIRCIHQRLQLTDGALFDLEDVYGVTEGHHEGEAVVDASVAEVDMEGVECVICMANERDTTAMPCRHMCLCGECAEVLRKQTNKCPICRTVIETLMTLKK